MVKLNEKVISYMRYLHNSLLMQEYLLCFAVGWCANCLQEYDASYNVLKILNVFHNAGHRISGETEILFFSTDKWSKWRLVDDFACSFVIIITLFLPKKGLYDRALLKELNIINKQ